VGESGDTAPFVSEKSFVANGRSALGAVRFPQFGTASHIQIRMWTHMGQLAHSCAATKLQTTTGGPQSARVPRPPQAWPLVQQHRLAWGWTWKTLHCPRPRASTTRPTPTPALGPAPTPVPSALVPDAGCPPSPFSAASSCPGRAAAGVRSPGRPPRTALPGLLGTFDASGLRT
jgi:hypothetical protein